MEGGDPIAVLERLIFARCSGVITEIQKLLFQKLIIQAIKLGADHYINSKHIGFDFCYSGHTELNLE